MEDYNYALLVVENPRKEFFKLHNKLYSQNFSFKKNKNIISEKASIADYNVIIEDYGVILIRYKSGKIVTIEGSAIVYPKNLEETLTVTGEKGTVVIGGMAVNKINTWRVEGDNEEDYLSIDCGDPNSVYGYGHEALYKDFIDALDENREPLVNGKAGLEAVKIILAAYKSQKTGLPIKFENFIDFSTSDMKKINMRIYKYENN